MTDLLDYEFAPFAATVEGKARPGVSPMTPEEFGRLSVLLRREVGIHVPPDKQFLLEDRVRRRLNRHGFTQFSDYYDFLLTPEGQDSEFVQFVDAVTTTTTEFFREPRHFVYLVEEFTPRWVALHGAKPMRLWSAGCSTGMEPYSMAMSLESCVEKHADFSYSILATDISTQALQQAVRAVYSEDALGPVPKALRNKYFQRSVDQTRRLVRVVPNLRARVIFRRLNFMDEFQLRRPLDGIFCRNVLMYFEYPTQKRLLNRLCDQLDTGGILMLDDSLRLNTVDLPLRQEEASIYIKI